MQDRSDPMARYDASALNAALTLELPSAKRGRHVYSNYGYAVLGHALALRGGAPLRDLVRQRICAPLALHDTGFGVTAEHATWPQAEAAASGPHPAGRVITLPLLRLSG